MKQGQLYCIYIQKKQRKGSVPTNTHVKAQDKVIVAQTKIGSAEAQPSPTLP